MLGCIVVVLKFNILYQGKEKPVKTKLMPAKLRAVLANFGLLQIFRKINMWGLISKRYSFKNKFDSVLSHLFREYLCENEFLRETILTCLLGAQVVWFMKKNARKSRDTATLNAGNRENSSLKISTVH